MDPTQNDSFGSFSSGQGGYIGQPGAYSAEPVVLGNDGRKKSKKWVWIILIGLLVVAITIVAVTMLTMSNEKKQKKAAAENAFYEVANYVMGGEDEDDDSGDLATRYDSLVESYTDNTDFIYAIRIRQEDFSAINDYYVKLNNKKQALLTAAKEVVQEETLNNYIESLRVLENAINYYTVRDGLLNAYKTGGESDAQKYLRKNIECDDLNWGLAVQCIGEMNYYEALLRDHINGDSPNDETYQLLQDGVLSEENLLLLNLGIWETQMELLKELNDE